MVMLPITLMLVPGYNVGLSPDALLINNEGNAEVAAHSISKPLLVATVVDALAI